VVTLSPPEEGPTCGVLPLGTPPRTISTRGLKWDLGPEHQLAYGAVVSSSNHAESTEVEITTDEAVLFTFELHDK
jgi:thiamine pyrophosphokinase